MSSKAPRVAPATSGTGSTPTISLTSLPPARALDAPELCSQPSLCALAAPKATTRTASANLPRDNPSEIHRKGRPHTSLGFDLNDVSPPTPASCPENLLEGVGSQHRSCLCSPDKTSERLASPREGDDENLLAVDEPRTIHVEIIWDTVCYDHVADRVDLSGHTVKESSGSKRGKT